MVTHSMAYKFSVSDPTMQALSTVVMLLRERERVFSSSSHNIVYRNKDINVFGIRDHNNIIFLYISYV